MTAREHPGRAESDDSLVVRCALRGDSTYRGVEESIEVERRPRRARAGRASMLPMAAVLGLTALLTVATFRATDVGLFAGLLSDLVLIVGLLAALVVKDGCQRRADEALGRREKMGRAMRFRIQGGQFRAEPDEVSGWDGVIPLASVKRVRVVEVAPEVRHVRVVLEDGSERVVMTGLRNDEVAPVVESIEKRAGRRARA